MLHSKTRIFIDGEVLVLPHYSGIGHYTMELVKAIDREMTKNPHVSVRLGVHFRHYEKALGFGLKNIKVVKTPFSHRVANALKIRRRQPYLDLLFGPSVYLFPNFSSWPTMYSKIVPIIYDLSFEKYPQFAEPRNRAFLSEQVRLSAKRAAFIATISENSKAEICEFYDIPEDKIGVYYPAVDTSHFYPRTKTEVDHIKKRLHVEGEYILFVGNIEPRKNLKNLLLAYEKLPSSLRKKQSLLLVGAKGWQDEEILSLINRLRKQGANVIQPEEYIADADLPAIYSGASLFVYPSMYEGFGIPPLEAMACGVPVLASDNSSLPEAVGDAAITADALSALKITKGMEQVLSDKQLQEKLRKKGIKQVEKFSWDKSARRLLEDLSRL